MSLLNLQAVRAQCQDRLARKQSWHGRSETAYEVSVDSPSIRMPHSPCRRHLNPIKGSVSHAFPKKETPAEFALLRCCQRWGVEVTGALLSNSSMLEGLSQDPASVYGDSVPHLPAHLPTGGPGRSQSLLLLLKQRLFLSL